MDQRYKERVHIKEYFNVFVYCFWPYIIFPNILTAVNLSSVNVKSTCAMMSTSHAEVG